MNLPPSTPEEAPNMSSSATARACPDLRLSFVVVIDKPEADLRTFFHTLEESVRSLPNSWEAICIDNTSSHTTWDDLKSIQVDNRCRMHLIRFRTVQKRGRALDAALARVTGDVVYLLNAERPEEIETISQMQNRLSEGYDVIVGHQEPEREAGWCERWTTSAFSEVLYHVNGFRLRAPLSDYFCFRTNVPKLSNVDGETIGTLPYAAARAGFEVTELPWKPSGKHESDRAKWCWTREIPHYLEKLTLSLWAEFRSASFMEATTPAFMVLILGAIGVTLSPFVSAAFQIAFLATGFMLITGALFGLQLFNAASIRDLVTFQFRDRLNESVVSEERHRVGTGLDEPASQKKVEALDRMEPTKVHVKDGEAKPRILVVDDDPMIQKLLSGILTEADCEVTTACDGEEGLNRVDEHTDVILLDLAMPRMDGFEFLKKYRSTSYDAKIIVISGAGRVKNVAKAFKEGAFDFMEKPFEISETVRLVRNAVHQRRLSREYLEVA